MRIKSKIFGLVMCLVMLISLVPAQATMQTESYVTREQAIDCIINTVGLGSLSETKSDLNLFTDASMIDPEYSDELAVAVANGILLGTPEKMLHPKRNITRLEFTIVLSRTFRELPVIKAGDTFSDVPAEYLGHVNKLNRAGLICGYGNGLFGSGDYLTQEQLTVVMNRIGGLSAIRPQDDFYYAANYDWLSSTRLPAGYPGLGTFDEVDISNRAKLQAIVQDLMKNCHEYEDGTVEQKIADFYLNILNTEKRNEQGIEPVLEYLNGFESVGTIEELMDYTAEFENETGVNPLFGFSPMVDLKDSSKYTLYGYGLSVNLPASLLQEQKYDELYLGFVAQILEYSGLSQEDAVKQAQDILALEKTLAQFTMPNEEANNVDNLYNLYTREQLVSLFAGIDLDKYLDDLGYESVENIVVYDVKLMEKTGELVAEENLDVLKSYARLRLILSTSPFLSTDIRDALNSVNAALLGINSTLSEEEQAFSLLNSVMSSYLGRVYVEKYFSEEAKKDVEGIVSDIIATYRKRIQNLDWMSESTKNAAIEKLDAMNVKIGYPDTWNDPLDGIEIKSYEDGGSLMDNIFAISSASTKYSKTLLDKPVDKSGWAMPPQTVNAYYSAVNNEIVFPAGILQPPYYDIDASREQNLGGIGTIIAHEITHAFDNNGARFDKNGNMANWWTEEDYAAFQEKCNAVVELYNGIEIAPDVFVNGVLTLSENISDIGAMACILDIVKEMPDPNYKELFESNARIWRFTGTNQIYMILAIQDSHSPGKLRSNQVLKNFQEFYDTYDIKPEDEMYLDPEKRVTIW